MLDIMCIFNTCILNHGIWKASTRIFKLDDIKCWQSTEILGPQIYLAVVKSSVSILNVVC